MAFKEVEEIEIADFVTEEEEDFMTKEEEEWEMRYQELKDQLWMLKYTTGNEHEQVRQYIQEGFRQLGFTKEEIFSMIPPRL